MNDTNHIHAIQIGEYKEFEIIASEEYSSNTIAIAKGQVYHIWCDEKQHWKDAVFTSNPAGYFNVFALLAGMRVKKTKCFCLCGVYDKEDLTGFPIGMDKTFITPDGKELSFFANDTKNHYKNNHGSIKINVIRLR